ncbi:WD40/YVTN/BNR-like repeat-containing protein [Paenibacillus sedimenti]|uniref:Photosynthesis system II assembly factor Ycf48/Hcf136-like domain-containing protein n=1 Tax=Paenibacillus sedimenti TaxID=2770274 RepID=A0A926KP87_9BACL|nr:YCF48-related protein [Paenibacillus sedimenti]MBD0380406.1 hypothetical protein [Paenibacillus sedimenti]
MAKMSEKYLLLILFFILCTGCMHHEDSRAAPLKTAIPKPKYTETITVASGAAIEMDESEWRSRGGERGVRAVPSLKPIQTAQFVDELHGFGLVPGLDDLSILETKDGGESWVTISSLAHSTNLPVISFLNDQTGWLLTGESINRKSELRLTSDGGQSWEIIARNLPGFGTLAKTPFFRFFDRQNGLIAIQKTNDMVMLRTEDGGLTWSASSRIQLPQAAAGVLTFVSPNEGWFASSDNKGEAILYRMSDGEIWLEAGKLPEKAVPQAISFSSPRNGWLLLHNKEEQLEPRWWLLRTEDGGSSWSRHSFPQTLHPMDFNTQMNFISSQTGWIQGANGLWQTTNGGMNWSMLSS